MHTLINPHLNKSLIDNTLKLEIGKADTNSPYNIVTPTNLDSLKRPLNFENIRIDSPDISNSRKK